MKAYEAYEKGDEKILGQWMDEQMGRFQKLETPQTKQTSKPSSEFDKALGDLGENELPSSSELPNNYIDKAVEPSQIKGDNFVMNESSRQNYPDRIKFELSEYLKSNTDINENPITASLNYLYNHHKDDGMFKSRKEVYELIKNVLDDVPDIVRKQDDGTYYFAKSLLQEPSNRQSIMQDIVLEPQVAENYIKHANTKHYSKEMSDKIRADGGSIQSPQLPQGAKTLENPELKNFSSTDDIIPQPNKNINPKIYAKGGDNLMAGVISGVEEYENGNLSINPAKFIAGLGGYTVAKKLLQNPKVQKGLKNVIGEQLAKLETRAERGDIYAQTIIGKNFLFTDPHLPNGKYMKGAFSDTATKQVMGEIDDSSVKTISKGELETLAKSDPYNMTELPLDRVLKHDELFAKYPELKNTKVVYESAKGEDELYYGANFNPKDNVIYLGNGVKSNEIKSALLHEIQHVIQTKEKWARGGSVEEFKLPYSSERYYAAIQKLKEERQPAINLLLEKLDKGEISFEQHLKMIESLPESKLIDELTQKALNSIDPYVSYKNLHGEQMARATEYRQNMTPDERIRESYTDTLKRVEGEAPEPIVKHGNGVAMSEVLKKKYFLKDGSINENVIRKESAPFRHIDYTFENFKSEFPDGKVRSPIGEINISSWQFKKIENKRRTKYFGLIKPTLENPSFVVNFEDTTFFFKAFRDNKGVVKFGAVTKDRAGMFDVTSNYALTNKKFDLIAKTGELVYPKSSGGIKPLEHSFRASDKILPNQSQKVKPADLTGNKLKGEYIKQKLESDTPHTMLYEADDIFTKDGKINLGLDIKDKRILKYLKDNGFKSDGSKISAKATDEAIEIARVAQKMAYKKQVDDVTKKMLEC